MVSQSVLQGHAVSDNFHIRQERTRLFHFVSFPKDIVSRWNRSASRFMWSTCAETFSNSLLCWGERVAVYRGISLISFATVTSFDIVQWEIWLQSYSMLASENNNNNNNNKLSPPTTTAPTPFHQFCSPTIRVLPRLFILRCPISFSRLHFQQNKHYSGSDFTDGP